MWVCFATPCSGVFLPVYLHGTLPAALARGGKEAEPDSAWWVMKRLQDAAERDPARCVPRVREGFAPLEAWLEAERRRAEAEAREAALAGDEDAAAERVGAFMEQAVAAALERAEELRARL